ncbi:MAG TPA: hypothetical protein VFA32_03820 [Dehalococcoidia bacterium]|nr:hypothetical protein [Dehalococcoidia bacterium]
MKEDRFYQFQVKLIRDKETGQVVVKIPALGIADYGANSQVANPMCKYFRKRGLPIALTDYLELD